MMENVGKFLKAAATYGATSLFTPQELVNGENLMGVVQCLHEIANIVSPFYEIDE